MPYQPIEHYGLIGNMHTAALVGRDGSVDWLCLPRFDAPSVFGALLDDAQGGRFRIAPAHDSVTTRQLYWPETNVLVTRFLSPDGIAEVIDYMPVGAEARLGALVRRVELIRGSMPLRLVCEPAFDYARADHETTLVDGGAVFATDALRLHLGTDVPLDRSERGVTAGLTLERGERAVFVLQPFERREPPPRLDAEAEERLFDRTVHYWQRWLKQCTYQGRWREQVHRSVLALKLLTYEPTGAVVAAPTCSLPEDIGGVRNWDYRYTWIRDAAFTIYGFLRVGFKDEAQAFMDWLRARCAECSAGEGLQLVYGIDGERDLNEVTLDHLEGYRGSAPVRIGNAAYEQLQLDIYGELLDSVYLYNKYVTPIAHDFWTQLARYVDWVCDNWERPDRGIWETRGGERHFVYSKLMCWVAVDRALRLASKRSFPADRDRWLGCRDAIYRDIMEHGWNESRGAFVQSYGAEALDASALIMPLVFFTSPSDPRMVRTLEATMRPPEDGGLLFDSLVYRYDTARVDDGLPGGEGTFNMCTFWLVEALTRAGRRHPGRLAHARLLFEKMLGYASPLGLYAEQTGPRGEALGNFPQAFTHLALISSAFNLDRTLDGEPYGLLG